MDLKQLLTLVLLISNIQLSLAQSGLDQDMELHKTNWQLGELLDTLQSKTGYTLSHGQIDKARKIILPSTNLTLKAILDRAFQDGPNQCQLKGDKLLIYPKPQQKGKKKATLSGYIIDAESSENLMGAFIKKTDPWAGTTSNNFGFFSLTVPTGPCELSISYVGYRTQSFHLNITKDTTFNVPMTLDVMDELVVSADKELPMVETTQMGTFNLKSQQIKQRPVIMGESDVLKTLQLLPGVQMGNEATSGLYVRGGGPDQNLVLLDGVPVYNLAHLFGFLSTFNTDAIKDVKLVKGAFPARYGGRLSSIVDVTLKEGNAQEFHGSGSLGLVASSLTLEGPIKNEKTSFLVSARRTFLDLF